METESLRGDFEYGWDEPVPSWKPFYRPAAIDGRPYTEWIHDSRYYVAPRSTFTTTFQPPWFTGFNDPNLGANALPHGIDSQGTALQSYWATQYCWNEFDYEVSTDIRFNSIIKPFYVGGVAGIPYGAEYTRKYALAQNDSLIAPVNFSIPFASDFFVVAHCRAYNYFLGSTTIPSVTWDHKLELRNLLNDSFSSLVGFLNPPLRTLSFDTTYNIKVRMSCAPVIYPNSSTITCIWLLDNSPFAIYELPTNQSVSIQWSNCTPQLSPPVWRLLECTQWQYRSFISKYAWYNANPALNIYWDNFKFNAIRK